jgi:hypothetical protein
MATELKQVVAPTIKPVTSTALPKGMEDMVFSIENFDVNQLPTQGEEAIEVSNDGAAVNSPSSKSVGVAAESPRAAESRAERGTERAPETKPRESSEREAEPSEAPSGAEVGEGIEQPGEPKKDLPKFLKPPKGKEGEVTEAKTSTLPKPIVPKQGQRDYNGFSDEEARAAKQMSNDAFSLYQKAVKDRNELVKVKDEQTYMQHPQAYVLDPGFQSVKNDLLFAQKEASHWEQQLINMDAGQELIPITGFNTQTGEAIHGQPIKPSKAIEEKVRMMIHNCYNVSQQLQGKLQEYPTKYQANVQKDLQAVQDYRKQQFGWVNDPSLLDYSINVEGLGERTLKQVRDDVQSIMPKWMHSHPLVSVVGDLVIALRIKQAELAEASSAQNVQQVKKSEQELVEPSSKSKPAGGRGGAVHGITEFQVDPNLGI